MGVAVIVCVFMWCVVCIHVGVVSGGLPVYNSFPRTPHCLPVDWLSVLQFVLTDRWKEILLFFVLDGLCFVHIYIYVS